MNKQLKKKIESQEYKFRIMFREKTDIIPETAADVLREIANENDGELKAEAVLDAARPVESAIHEWFEWNDGAAAEKHRLWQARSLVKSVRVIRDNKPEEPVFVHVNHGRTGHYIEAARIVHTVDEWEAAKREVQAHIQRAIASIEDLRRIAKNHGRETEAAELVRALTSVF